MNKLEPTTTPKIDPRPAETIEDLRRAARRAERKWYDALDRYCSIEAAQWRAEYKRLRSLILERAAAIEAEEG